MLPQTLVRTRLEEAVSEARLALQENNYPIGCVVTDLEGKLLVKTRNQYRLMQDVTSHAEILALRHLGLSDEKVILFSSLEPCYGCSFFIVRAPITAIYSGLTDPHKGGISNLKSQEQFMSFFKDIAVINEPFMDLRDESRKLMRTYFLKQGKEKQAAFYKDP